MSGNTCGRCFMFACSPAVDGSGACFLHMVEFEYAPGRYWWAYPKKFCYDAACEDFESYPDGRWCTMFSTPERAAESLSELFRCADCPAAEECMESECCQEAILSWLNGKDEI